MSAIQLALIVLNVMLFVPRSQGQNTSPPVSISVAFVITLKPQHQYAYSPIWPLYISYVTSRENLFKTQQISSFVIMFSVLMTCTVCALSGGDIVRRSLMQVTIGVIL